MRSAPEHRRPYATTRPVVDPDVFLDEMCGIATRAIQEAREHRVLCLLVVGRGACRATGISDGHNMDFHNP